MKKLSKDQKRILALVSSLGTILFFWFLASGKIKSRELINPFIGRVVGTKDFAGIGEKVLGTVEEAVSSQNTQKILGEGAKVLENSPLAESVKETQERIIQKVNETIETIKELPDQEVKRIKKEVCKQWMEE